MKDRDSIVKRILSYVNDKYDKTKGGFFYDATKPASIELENVYHEIDIASGKINVVNLSGTELEMFIKDRTGIERKLATFASAEVTIKGLANTEVNKGILVASDIVNYEVANNAVIDKSGQVTVTVIAEKAGIIGNVIAGSIKSFPITISGLTSVTNPKDVVNGYEAETDTSLLERYYDRIRTPATSGNIHHYRNWAKEVPGVGDAKVVPLWAGNGTVKIVIVDSSSNPANSDLLTKVEKNIADNRPIGATETVVSAIAKDITVKAKVSLVDGYRIQLVQNDFKVALEEYRKESGFKDSYISYAAVNNVLFNVPGVLDSNNLTLNGEMKNIALNDEEIAIFKLVELEVM